MLRLSIALAVLASSAARLTWAEADAAPQVATKDRSTQTASLPQRADLRPRMKEWGLAARHQGRRNTCSVFATTGVLEFAASKHYGRGTRFSAEYLNWACNQIINNHSQDRGQFFRDLLKGFAEHGICPDSEMPYRKKFGTGKLLCGI